MLLPKTLKHRLAACLRSAGGRAVGRAHHSLCVEIDRLDGRQLQCGWVGGRHGNPTNNLKVGGRPDIGSAMPEPRPTLPPNRDALTWPVAVTIVLTDWQ